MVALSAGCLIVEVGNLNRYNQVSKNFCAALKLGFIFWLNLVKPKVSQVIPGNKVMKSIVAGLSLVALAVPARADIFVSPTSSEVPSTLLVAGLLAAATALVMYFRKSEA